MNKIIQKYCALLLIFALNAGALFVVGETHAYFSDTAVVSENTFSTGTLKFSLDVGEWKPDTELLPGNTIRKDVDIENSGSLDFHYSVKVEIDEDSSDMDFCEEISLTAKLNGDGEYGGDLENFNASSFSIDKNGEDEWEFILERNNNEKSGNCNFDLVFEAWQENLSKNEGFTDLKKLSNDIHNSTEKIEREKKEEEKEEDDSDDLDDDSDTGDDPNGTDDDTDDGDDPDNGTDDDPDDDDDPTDKDDDLLDDEEKDDPEGEQAPDGAGNDIEEEEEEDESEDSSIDSDEDKDLSENKDEEEEKQKEEEDEEDLAGPDDDNDPDDDDDNDTENDDGDDDPDDGDGPEEETDEE